MNYELIESTCTELRGLEAQLALARGTDGEAAAKAALLDKIRELNASLEKKVLADRAPMAKGNIHQFKNQ